MSWGNAERCFEGESRWVDLSDFLAWEYRPGVQAKKFFLVPRVSVENLVN